MSIKLTWKDNTSKETRYEVWKILSDGSREHVADVPVDTPPNSKGGTYEWVGTGSYDCGDHTFDIAAVSETDQRAWLPEPVTITLPCDDNVVICNRFETNAGNSAPAAVPVEAVYNLTTYTNTTPAIKTDMDSSAFFNGTSVVTYPRSGPHASKLAFYPWGADTTNRDFTVEGWFRFNNFDTEYNENGGLLFSGSNPNDTLWLDRMSIQGGVFHTPNDAIGDKVAKVFFHCRAGTQSGTFQEYVTSQPCIKTNTWTHIAWVKKQARLYIYIDGELFESFYFTGLNIAPQGTLLGMRIGTGTSAYNAAKPGMNFIGNMLDFRIINGQAITICPDTFTDATCIVGPPVDEVPPVDKEWLQLNACDGVNIPARTWVDESEQNTVTLPSATAIEQDNNACPCEVRVRTALPLPKTSTFTELNSFSFATYFKTNVDIADGTSYKNLIDMTYTQGLAKYGFKVTMSSTENGNSGTLDIIIGNGLQGDWKLYSSNKNSWKANLWHHIIVIHDGTRLMIYIDGKFHKGIQNVQTLENHEQFGYIGSGNWNQNLYLSTYQFYKNHIFNAQEIEYSYDPPLTTEGENPCGGLECESDISTLDFTEWTDSFSASWSNGGGFIVAEDQDTHPAAQVEHQTDGSVVVRTQLYKTNPNGTNAVYIMSPDTYKMNSTINKTCFTAKVTGTSNNNVNCLIYAYQNGKIYLLSRLSSGASGELAGGGVVEKQNVYIDATIDITPGWSTTGDPLDLTSDFRIMIGLANSRTTSTTTITKFDMCLAAVGKKCLPPKYPPTDPNCDDLVLHLSEAGRPTATEFNHDHPLIDSSKYARKFISEAEQPLITQQIELDLESSLETSNPSPLLSGYYDMDDYIKHSDDFRFSETGSMCIDGYIHTGQDVNITKCESTWKVTAGTKTYNGHDWYIKTIPGEDKLEFAHGITRVRVDVPANDWVHVVVTVENGDKLILVDGKVATLTVFNDIDMEPTTLNKQYINVTGVFDDLRIIKDNHTYIGPYEIPNKPKDYSCRKESAEGTCVLIDNDERFSNWSVVTDTPEGSTADSVIIEHPAHEVIQVETTTGPRTYISLTKNDVVSYTYKLGTTKEINIEVDVDPIRTESTDGHDIYFTVKQDTTSYMYSLGTTGSSDGMSTKKYTIDMETFPGWGSAVKIGSGTIDLDGTVATEFGIALGTESSGTLITDIHRVNIDITSTRCIDVITPNQPVCDDVILHLNSTDQDNGSTIIRDSSSYSNKLTYDSVSHVQGDSKYGNTSIEFSSLSAGYINVSETDQFNLGNDPFTVEFWANFDDITSKQYLYSLSNGVSGGEFFAYIDNNDLTFKTGTSEFTIDSSKLADEIREHQLQYTGNNLPASNNWHHFAVVGTGTDVKVYADGALAVIQEYELPNLPGVFTVGSLIMDNDTNNVHTYTGKIDDFRVTKGSVVYNGNKFKPPVKHKIALSDYTNAACNNTVLQLQSINFPDGNDVINDYSGNNNTVINTGMSHTTDTAILDSSSVFETNRQSVNIKNSTNFSVLSGQDFTIDGWINATLQGSTTANNNDKQSYGIISYSTSRNTPGWSVFVTPTGSIGFQAVGETDSIYIQSDSGKITRNKWHHYAVTRSNNKINVYVDGVSRASGWSNTGIVSDSIISVAKLYSSTNQGRLQSYMQDVRYVVGESVYNGCASTLPDKLQPSCDTYVTPDAPDCDDILAHMQIGALDITDKVVDMSRHANPLSGWTTNSINQDQDRYYYQKRSNDLDVIVYDLPDEDQQLGDLFTIETYIKPQAVTGDSTIVWSGSSMTDQTGFELLLSLDNNNPVVRYITSDTDISSPTGKIQINQWNHVALCRTGTGDEQTRLYINGKLVNKFKTTNNPIIHQINGQNRFVVGGKYDGTIKQQTLDADLNDIRITNNHAVYLGEYQLPTLGIVRYTNEEPLLADVKLFIQSEGNVGSTTITDISKRQYNIINSDGVISHTDTKKKFGDTSIYFPGSSEILLPRIRSEFTDDLFKLKHNDFTYEMWVYPEFTEENRILISLDKSQFEQESPNDIGHDAILMEITQDNGVKCTIRSYNNLNPSDSTGTGVGVITTKPNVISQNTWHHIAWTSEKGKFRVYIDGVDRSIDQRTTSTANSNTWNFNAMDKTKSDRVLLNYLIGGNGVDAGFKGYMDGFRYVNGYAVYTECSYVVPTDKSPLNRQTPKDAACSDVKVHVRADTQYDIADFSGNENTTELQNLTKDDTNWVLNGLAAIPLSGQGMMKLTNEEDADFGKYTSPITYEAWLKPPATQPNSGDGVEIFDSQPVKCHLSDDEVVVSVKIYINGVTEFIEKFRSPVTPGQWFHLAITNPSHKTWNVYIDGIRVAFKTFTQDLTYKHNNYVTVGLAGQSNNSQAHVDDFRITTDTIISGDSNIYDQLLPMCDSSPGVCIEFPSGYETLKLCMSFESTELQDMSRYTHDVSTVSGNSGIVLDEDHQSYLDGDGVKQYYHQGYHGTRYQDISQSSGITVTSSDHLNIKEQEFAIEIHIPATFTQTFDNTDGDQYFTLYHHDGSNGDRLTIAFKPINGTIALVAELVSGSNQLQLVANAPQYDFTDTTRGEALQRVMLSRQQGAVRLYGYHNTDEGQSFVIASDVFTHELNLDYDVKIGYYNPVDFNQTGAWNDMIDSIRVTVGGIMGNCNYIEKKQCIKCEGFTGDVDAVKYICSVARSIGIQPADIDYDKLYEINNFVVTLKDQGVWDNVKVLYLPVWENALANSINVKSPSTHSLNSDWIFNQESGVWVHDNGPYVKLTEYDSTTTGNGIMTPFTGGDLSLTSTDYSYGVYVRGVPSDTQSAVMSTTSNDVINVDSTTCSYNAKGFLLKSRTTASSTTTYTNGSEVSTQTNPVFDPSHKWVVGGEGVNGSGVMQNGVNNIEIQAIHIGKTLTKTHAQNLSSAIVKLIQTFDKTDNNPSDIISEDYLTNKAAFAILNRKGYTYTNPSWMRERNATPGLNTQSLDKYQLYTNLKQFYNTGSTDNWLNGIKTLHLPMWRDSNVNKINFMCPGTYDIDKWNKRSPFWRLDETSTLLNPPSNNGSPILPVPAAYFSPDNITDTSGTYITEWKDQASSNDLSLDTSAHDNLETEPTGPVFIENGGLNGDEKCVRFEYNGSRNPAARHEYLTNRAGNKFRMVMNSNLSITRPKHVFLVYRNITSVNHSTPITFYSEDQLDRPGYNTAPGIRHTDHNNYESYSYTGYGVTTVNGYRGSYYDGQSNGLLTWSPEPTEIDENQDHAYGTPMLPETRFGKRVVHVNMAEELDNSDDYVTCPFPASDNDGNTLLPEEVKLCLGNLDTNNPVCIHGEYFEMVMYDEHLTHDQVEAVYNYLCGKHEVSLHEDYTNHIYSGNVTHGHGDYSYIPSNNPVTIGSSTNITQGTELHFTGNDTNYAYGSEYIGITNTTGGFGSIKFGTTICASTTHTENTMGSLVDDGWTLGKSTNTFNIPDTTGIDLGFSYINRDATDNQYYLNNYTVPASTYTRQSTTIPVENPYLFSTGDSGSPVLGTKDKYQAFFYTDDLVTTQQLSGFGNAVTNLTSNNTSTVLPVCPTYSSNPYVQNYICAVVNAGGIHPDDVATDNRVGAIDQYIKSVTASNELTDLYTAIYLPIWRCSEANKINLISPGEKQLIIDDDKIDHETGDYIRYLGTGTGTEFSNEVVVPYRPRDIVDTPCDETYSTDWKDSLKFGVFVNVVNLPTTSGKTNVMWRFQQNELSNKTTSQQNYTNDYYNPGVSSHDLVGVTWPGNGDEWHAGPHNTHWKDQPTGDGTNEAPLYKWRHDQVQQGGLFKCLYLQPQAPFGLDTTRSKSTYDDPSRFTTVTLASETLHDKGGKGTRRYNVPQYYMTMPMGGATDTCVNFIALGRALPDDDTVREFLFKLAGSSYKTYTDQPVTSDYLETHGVQGLTTGHTITLNTIKNAAKFRSVDIPQSNSTITTPLTSVWDDDRVWNFKLANYTLEQWCEDTGNDPDQQNYTRIRSYYNGSSFSHNNSAVVTSFGLMVRRPQGAYDDLYGREYSLPWNNTYSYQVKNAAAQPYIRGLTSGAVRRSTFGFSGSPYNDGSSGNEKRYIQWKIDRDNPHKGVYVGGGSSRTNDTSTFNATTTGYRDTSSTGIDDTFNKYPSNNIPFQQGEMLEIGHIDWSESNTYRSHHQHGFASTRYLHNTIDVNPLRSNIEFYNGKYRVAEVQETAGQLLSDGAAFSNSTTHGGPNATGDGSSHDTHAWMRIDMADIETIDIGPTNKNDLLITSTLSGGTNNPQNVWSTRMYVDHPDTYTYKLTKSMNEQLYVCGSYSDYIVVNYDLDKHEMYSVNMDCQGNEQTTTASNPEGYLQAFTLKVDSTSGKPVRFRTTKGKGRSVCRGATEDSRGNIYMVGSVSGDVDFTDTHGMHREVNRGVSTGGFDSKFGFIAKSHMDHTQIDSTAEYKPLDHTWAWVQYIDTTTESLTGERVVSDVVVDQFDQVYVVGYYDSPSEIGTTAVTNHDDDNLKFEPGYTWDDTTESTVFVSKFTDQGRCVWTETSRVINVDTESQKLQIKDGSLYVMCVADKLNFQSTTVAPDLSGVCINKLDCDNGNITKAISFDNNKQTPEPTPGWNMTVTDFKVTDHNMIIITGTCNARGLISDNITFTNKFAVDSTDKVIGYAAFIPTFMQTGELSYAINKTSTDDTPVVLNGSAIDYTTGLNNIIGTAHNWTAGQSIEAGFGSPSDKITINHDTNYLNNTQFILTHEL